MARKSSFGSRPGSQPAAIDLALSDQPQAVKQIAPLAGAASRRVSNRLPGLL
ncbi:hypothetical protein PLANPX_2792 [Lacipirellula parvula]|uniref:Uncharacterized protein n=1 Tax=Lacipirellula parvula TaxID=2650471 RepID=A0A5K7X930_9BACT|nr:hypothetical protein PLANPX_2792 [Lacipirellula parvula]